MRLCGSESSNGDVVALMGMWHRIMGCSSSYWSRFSSYGDVVAHVGIGRSTGD